MVFSAVTGEGVEALLDAIIEQLGLPAARPQEEPEEKAWSPL
jgi:hypothetical protein